MLLLTVGIPPLSPSETALRQTDASSIDTDLLRSFDTIESRPWCIEPLDLFLGGRGVDSSDLVRDGDGDRDETLLRFSTDLDLGKGRERGCSHPRGSSDLVLETALPSQVALWLRQSLLDDGTSP